MLNGREDIDKRGRVQEVNLRRVRKLQRNPEIVARLLVVGPEDDEEVLREEVMTDLTTLVNSIDKSERGVCVQASTLGSLEALLDFLKSSKIPVSGIGIGPVHKKDIMRAATMLEKAKELACILCFDVSVDKDAERLAEEMGIRLFKGAFVSFRVLRKILY